MQTNAPAPLTRADSPDHAQALQRVRELEHELQALRNLVIFADVALESVELSIMRGREFVERVDETGGVRWLANARAALTSARHELGATRRSLGVVR